MKTVKTCIIFSLALLFCSAMQAMENQPQLRMQQMPSQPVVLDPASGTRATSIMPLPVAPPTQNMQDVVQQGQAIQGQQADRRGRLCTPKCAVYSVGGALLFGGCVTFMVYVIQGTPKKQYP